MKRQTSFRASPLTEHQLRELCDRYGLTATEVIAVAIDRLYREQLWSTGSLDPAVFVYAMLYLGQRLAALPETERPAALEWCRRWLAKNTEPHVLQSGAERWSDARQVADAAVAAYQAHRLGTE